MTEYFHALFEAGRTFAPSHTGFLALGPALELSHVRPTAGAPGVALAAPKSNLEPLLRAELRYELSAGSFSFGAAAFVDLALMKTNYELSAGVEHQVLAQPARLRPGAQLGIAVR